MGKLLSYSGISTKIRAMQSKLITEDQIQEMLQFKHITCRRMAQADTGVFQNMGIT